MGKQSTDRDIEKLNDIYDLIWVDTERAWAEAQAAVEKYKGKKLTYSSARAQMLFYIIAIMVRSPLVKQIDAFAIKAFFEENNFIEEASLLTLRMTWYIMQSEDIDMGNSLDAEYEKKYAAQAPLEQKVMRISLKANFNMMRELNKTAQIELALAAEDLLRATPGDSAWYRVSMAQVLQIKAEALSHSGDMDLVRSVMDEATALVDVPGTSPYLGFSTYYFQGNVAAVAGLNEEALKSYYLLEGRYAGRSFYDSLLIYVYIQIFKQLNEIFSKQATRREELIVEQSKYLTLAKSLAAANNRPYMINYLLLSEARLMRATRQYSKAILLLARVLPYFARSNYNNHVIDIWEEAYHTYRGWADSEKSYTLYRKAAKALINVTSLTHKYNQAEGKEKLDAIINKYELQKKELSEKLLHQKMDAMNKEMQLTAINLHEKVKVLDELKDYVKSLKKKGQETNQLINAIAKKIDTVILTEQDKSTLLRKIEETNNEFFKILSEKFPSLSSLEIRMCGMLKTGMTNKELAKLYGQSERSYEQHRYRIKKKLGLAASENLVKYLTTMSLENSG